MNFLHFLYTRLLCNSLTNGEESQVLCGAQQSFLVKLPVMVQKESIGNV